MSLSNIKEGEEKQEVGKGKTHDCGGAETWEENEAVDILGQERQNTYRDTALVTWTPPHNKTQQALLLWYSCP